MSQKAISRPAKTVVTLSASVVAISDPALATQISDDVVYRGGRRESGAAIACLREAECATRMDQVPEVLCDPTLGSCRSLDNSKRVRHFGELVQIPLGEVVWCGGLQAGTFASRVSLLLKEGA